MGESLKLYHWLREVMVVWQPLRLLRAFAAGRRAGVAIITAVSMIPLLLMAGAATDFGRLYIAKSRLHYALDQGLLAVGAHDPSATPEDLQTVFDNYFNANYPTGKLGTPSSTPLDINGSEIRATATATVPTLFLKITGIPALEILSVSVGSQVIRQTTGVELALVLDNTASLSAAELTELKNAANNLVTTLFAGANDPNDVKISVVPFTSTVNIGAANVGLINAPSPAHEYPTNVDTVWKGCVEARPSPNDVQDTFNPGGGAQGEWAPYFWEAETYYTVPAGFGECVNRWWRPDSGIDPTTPFRPTGRPPPLFATIPGSFEDPAMNPLPSTTPGSSVGPNKACPTAIQPLTSTQATITAAINAMQAWDGGGTLTNVGAVWGWRTLSPTLPFDQGEPYGDPNINKVVVLLTDGENEILGTGAICLLSNPARYNSQYTAYDYVSQANLEPTGNINLAQAELNQRLLDVCANMKAPGVDVEIFAITFGAGAAGAAIAPIMQACATSAGHYFHAPSGADLTTAFQAIGARLVNLRVAQ